MSQNKIGLNKRIRGGIAFPILREIIPFRHQELQWVLVYLLPPRKGAPMKVTHHPSDPSLMGPVPKLFGS